MTRSGRREVFAGFCTHERSAKRRAKGDPPRRGISLIVTNDGQVPYAAVLQLEPWLLMVLVTVAAEGDAHAC